MTDPAETVWVLTLVKGLLGLLLAGVIFLAARYRWRERDQARGPADIGLD